MHRSLVLAVGQCFVQNRWRYQKAVAFLGHNQGITPKMFVTGLVAISKLIASRIPSVILNLTVDKCALGCTGRKATRETKHYMKGPSASSKLKWSEVYSITTFWAVFRVLDNYFTSCAGAPHIELRIRNGSFPKQGGPQELQICTRIISRLQGVLEKYPNPKGPCI